MGRNNKSQRNTMSNSQRSSISDNRRQRGSNSNNNRELEELRNEVRRLTESKDAMQAKADALSSEHEELSNIAKDIEKERDFYFNKVVTIENILKQEQNQESPLLVALYELLYQTEEQQKTEQQEQLNDNVY